MGTCGAAPTDLRAELCTKDSSRSRKGLSSLGVVAELRCVPLVSTAMFLEYESALLRAEQRLATGMSVPDISAFLAAFASAAEPIEINFRWRPQLRDPADEMVLETAVNGNALAIVTHNIRDFRSAADKFGIRIITPAEFVKELKQ